MFKIKKIITIQLLLFFILPAINIAAEDAFHYFDSGVKFFDQKDYEDAIKAFKMATEKKEDFVEAYYNIGIIYDLQERFQDAIDAYKKAVQIDPTIENALGNLAVDCYKVGNIKDALIYTKLAESHGKPVDEELKKLFDSYANEDIEYILNPLSLLDTGQLNEMKMQIESEINILEQELSEKRQPSPNDFLNLALKYRQMGNIDKAIEIITRAVNTYGENYKILAELSLCYFLKGNKSLFMEKLKKARTKGYIPSNSLSDLYLQSSAKN